MVLLDCHRFIEFGILRRGRGRDVRCILAVLVRDVIVTTPCPDPMFGCANKPALSVVGWPSIGCTRRRLVEIFISLKIQEITNLCTLIDSQFHSVITRISSRSLKGTKKLYKMVTHTSSIFQTVQ